MTAPGAATASGTDAGRPAGGHDPTVIYIAGSGRSGSTLLERVLGDIPGLVNVGELIDLWRRTAPRGELCGCGLAFADCPFWTGVGKRAFGGWDADKLAAVHQLQTRIARQRHLPRVLALPLAGGSFRDEVAEYGESYRALYRAVADQAGADYVVDASKWPVQALALHRAGIDIRVIHLVRDVRGVAHSLTKQIERPHAVAQADHMSNNIPAEAAARWVGTQGQAELLRRCGLQVTRIRYEDFVVAPRQAVESALADIGIFPQPSDLAHIGDGRVVLGSSHGLSGNPSRFSSGEITLRADEAWRMRMSPRDRAVVTTVGLPLLVRYGWRLGNKPQPEAEPKAPSVPSPAQQDKTCPLVSVIMPTRERPELVRESINSVVGQDYPGDMDIIVVHDRETPDEDLIALGTPRHSVRVVGNTHSPGLAGARNTGLDLARGDFIATCDDDDTWHSAKLRLQIDRLLGDPGLLVVGTGIRLLLPDDKIHDWRGRSDEISYQLLLRNRVKELHSSTLVMRREVFASAGPYDEELPNGYSEDYDWVLRAARAGRVGLIAAPLANIRKNATSWYRGKSENALPGLEYMLAKHTDFATSRRGHARMLGQIAFARSTLGQRGPAVRDATKAISRWPVSPYPYIALAQAVTGVNPDQMLKLARLFRRGMG
ncbi:MAG TPA: glycosyltransferase [Streptosporangiaceae bacterium]